MDYFTSACFFIPIIGFTISVYNSWKFRQETLDWEQKLTDLTAEIDMARRPQNSNITWKTKDGEEIIIADMSNSHLSNALKMVARTVNKAGSLDQLSKDKSYQKLSHEAHKRKFIISFLNTPIMKDGRYDYLDVFIPTPPSKISASHFPTEWDSRPQEEL